MLPQQPTCQHFWPTSPCRGNTNLTLTPFFMSGIANIHPFLLKVPEVHTTWFHPVWYRIFQKLCLLVQILWYCRFCVNPTYIKCYTGAIFEFCHFTEVLLTVQYSAYSQTHNTTQLHTTTKMELCRPTLQRCFPLSL